MSNLNQVIQGLEKNLDRGISVYTFNKTKELIETIKSNGFVSTVNISVDDNIEPLPAVNYFNVQLKNCTMNFNIIGESPFTQTMLDESAIMRNLKNSFTIANKQSKFGYISISTFLNIKFNNFNENLPIGFVFEIKRDGYRVHLVSGAIGDLYSNLELTIDGESVSLKNILVELIKDWILDAKVKIYEVVEPTYANVLKLFNAQEIHEFVGPALVEMLYDKKLWDIKAVTNKLVKIGDMSIELDYERDVEPYLDKKYEQHCLLAASVLRDYNIKLYQQLLDEVKNILTKAYRRTIDDLYSLSDPYGQII